MSIGWKIGGIAGVILIVIMTILGFRLNALDAKNDKLEFENKVFKQALQEAEQSASSQIAVLNNQVAQSKKRYESLAENLKQIDQDHENENDPCPPALCATISGLYGARASGNHQ